MLSKTTIVVIGVLALAAGAAVAGASSIVGTPEDMTAQMIQAETAKPATEVSSDLVLNFALFRRQAASSMPASTRSQIGTERRFGRNADLARRIETVGGPGWVIPGNGFVCIAVPDPVDGFGTTCSSIRGAVDRGLWIRLASGDPDGKGYDTVLAPDGQEAVDANGDAMPARLGVSSRSVLTHESEPSVK